MFRRFTAAVFAAAVFWPSPARAYDEEVHAFLARAALEASLTGADGTVTTSAAANVRKVIDDWARNATDAGIRAEWLRRYPTPEAFDAWSEKEFLLLAPESNVFGIDRVPASGGADLLSLVETGSREPDDDLRNRERLGYDGRRQKLKDQQGHDVPADPALLNMGRLGGLSSQAHAHYGLAALELSDDPDVLKKDPRRFAVAAGYPAGPVLTLAAEMAEEHLDLALIAATMEPANLALTWLYTGQAFHYLEDVSNQIHTVQVGIYDFFVDATIERLKIAFGTFGGYFGAMRSLASIGIDILTNHHVLSESLTKKRVLEQVRGHPTPEGERLVAAPKTDDADFLKTLDEALAKSSAEPWKAPFGLVMTRAMIEVSSHEGADVYRATRAIADPSYRKAGVHYDEKGEDPDQALRPPDKIDHEAYQSFFALQERAFRRAGTAMRRWVALERRALDAAKSPAEREALRATVAERLVRRQLGLLAQAESRRADYLAHPLERHADDEHMPLAAALDALALLGVSALIIRFIGKKKGRG